MRFVNLKSGIIFNGYAFDDSIEFPNNKYVDVDGTIHNVEVVAVDDALVTTLIVLNKKGYETLFSCAGHADEGYNYGYIYFKDNIFSFYDVTNPNRDIDLFNNKHIFIDNSKIIRAKQGSDVDHGLSVIELTKAINDFNTELLKWALALPNFGEISK